MCYCIVLYGAAWQYMVVYVLFVGYSRAPMIPCTITHSSRSLSPGALAVLVRRGAGTRVEGQLSASPSRSNFLWLNRRETVI